MLHKTTLTLNYSKVRVEVLKPVLERFLEKISVSDDGCWNWTACKDRYGYGQFSFEGKTKLAHKILYEQYKGKIPKELQIDHLCRNRKCVNPLHLETVPNRENIMRGIGITSINAKKTHCIHGHEFTAQNTIIKIVKNRKQRNCKTCYYIQNTEYRKRRNSIFRKKDLK